MKKEKGITLIALVITIIVMLILVAVSVTVALNGGLFRTAKQASDETALEKDREHNLSTGRIKIGGVWYDSFEKYNQGIPSDNQEGTVGENDNPAGGVEPGEGEGDSSEEPIEWKETTKPTGWSNNVVAMTEGTNIIPLPTGYQISKELTEDSIEEGLVIKDSNNNEFVWIPVSDENSFENSYNYSSGYSEPTLSSNDTQANLNKYYGTKADGTTPYYTLETDFAYSNHYAEMVASVNKYDGFYVGRYETTIDDAGNIGSKNNTTVLTADSILKEGTNSNYYNDPYYYRWWGLYYDQRNTDSIVANGTIVQSTMMWGQQWDAMMDFLGEEHDNSKIKGYYSQVLKSGEATYDEGLKDVMNNIYDLRRNGWEWTAEANSTNYRVHRGGNYRNGSSASGRSYNVPFDTSDIHSSRLALYIK